MLVEYDLNNKIIGNDGSVDVETLRDECSRGVNPSLRHRVYKLLILGLGSNYTQQRESGDIAAYNKLCDEVRSDYSQGNSTFDGAFSDRKVEHYSNLLSSNFPEYNFSPVCNNDFSFISTSNEVSANTTQSTPQMDVDTDKNLIDLDPSCTKPLLDITKCPEGPRKGIYKTLNQIQKDIPRIPQEFRIFKLDNGYVDVSYMYERILFLYSTLFQSEYMQGTGSLLMALIYSFATYDCDSKEDLKKIEANAFLCYATMFKGLKEDVDSTQAGIIQKIKSELKSKEEKLFNHLEHVEVNIEGLLFRWVTNLFLHEFALDDSLRIFDFMISYGPQKLRDVLIYLSVSIFGYYKDEFLEQNQSVCQELIYVKDEPFTKKGRSSRDTEAIIRKARNYMNERSSRN